MIFLVPIKLLYLVKIIVIKFLEKQNSINLFIN
jgi:hypothetical protein